jgi:hypothetical protein
MKGEDKPLTMPPTGKTEEVWQAEIDFRTGFLVDSGGDRPAGRDRQETARFPRASSSNPAAPRRLPSHTFCVGTLDLASVSMTVRSISNSVRRNHSPVSTNVRQKTPLIARRPHFDCAPLQVEVTSAVSAVTDWMRTAANFTPDRCD